jgi:hypothetical protein
MRIGTGLPNQVRDMRPAVIPAWARQAENAVCRAKSRAAWLSRASTLGGHVPQAPVFDLCAADRLVRVARSE